MITGKNIDEALKQRHFEKAKEFFKKSSSKSGKVEYIKNIYGTGGWGIPGYGDFISSCSYDSEGVEFVKRTGINTEKMQMSWTKVAERIEKIIESESQISLF